MKTIKKIWDWLVDAFWPFILAAIITLLLLLCCSSCTVHKPVCNGDFYKYHSELQQYYKYQQKHLNK